MNAKSLDHRALKEIKVHLGAINESGLLSIDRDHLMAAMAVADFALSIHEFPPIDIDP